MPQLIDTENKLTIVFEPRMDSAMCTTIESEVMTAVSGTTKSIEFDLKQVDFIASPFLRICMAVFKKVGAGRLTITNVSPSVKKVYKIAGLDSFITIE